MNYQLTAADMAEVAAADMAAARDAGTFKVKGLGFRRKVLIVQPAGPRKSPRRAAIAKALTEGALTRGEVAASVGGKPDNVGSCLRDMIRAGTVQATGPGNRQLYRLTEAGRVWLAGQEADL